ncbi:metallophosphoesterase [Arcobacter sp. F2176]|uniref:metallophosphoesterase n=1 Tax=Arcobacter sp. F2176 TaxID=2044511 RepID=UPI00100C1BDE|nr:metallophosphoesterase [Arcobacter sp. F2176]RXJ79859.1 metallophosphoesterase [Arcobacter sp. F2176]
MRFILFATVFILVMGLLSLFISKRFIKKLDISKKSKLFLNIFLLVNFLGVVAYMCTRYLISVPNDLYFLLSLPIGVIFLLFCTTLMYEVLSHLPKIKKDEKRRAFMKKSIDFGSLAFATSITAKAIYNAKQSYIEKVNVKIPNLKKPYNVVQLSDVHIGGLIDQDFIKNIVYKVNKLNPDAVFITGDLVDTNIKFAKNAIDELKNLKSKYGTYFIVGNHEYFHGVEEIITYLKSINISVLENENVYIGKENQGFNLAGVYDIFGYRANKFAPDIKKALVNVKDSPTILLAHQPKYINELDNQNIDLVLSGHTHGGQIVPFNLLVRLEQPYIKGLHQHNSKTQIYVSKGTGFWGPPMRLGASSEITYLKITS